MNTVTADFNPEISNNKPATIREPRVLATSAINFIVQCYVNVDIPKAHIYAQREKKHGHVTFSSFPYLSDCNC